MKITDLTVRYGDKTVLDSFSFSVEQNELVLFTAPSGFGKTTLFRAIAGLVKPSSGCIEGVGVVSYAFQEARLLPWFSALENVCLVRPDKSKEEAQRLLLSLGFPEEALAQLPEELSGGMRQRVNLARSFFYEGDLLLLDEPFAGLDESNAQLVMDEIQRQRQARPVLMICHENDWDALADRIIRMDEKASTSVKSVQ